MQVAKFEEIKEQFKLKDENFYFYTAEADGTLRLRPVPSSGAVDYQIRMPEYELLAEEGLKGVYDSEPEGLWEQCLEG